LKNFITQKATSFITSIEGSGTWFIEDEPNEVKAGDLVIVPPNKQFYYKGNLKQICITAPSWEPEFEHHTRDIDFENR
jgi:mannose-6-phosphate isomerase-like protein (cupin superfamily)